MTYVTEWARAGQQKWLLRDFYTFAKNTICPDIEEDPYREVCDWLESRIPVGRCGSRSSASCSCHV